MSEKQMTTVDVIRVGEELGIILPPETLKHLNVQVGDSLYITEQSDGIRLSVVEPETLDAMKRVMRENRETLKKLADS